MRRRDFVKLAPATFALAGCHALAAAGVRIHVPDDRPSSDLYRLDRYKNHAHLPVIRAFMHLGDLGMSIDEFEKFRKDIRKLRNIEKWAQWWNQKCEGTIWLAEDGQHWPDEFVWLAFVCTAKSGNDTIGWLNGEEPTTPEERHGQLLHS